jgi:hypothetical protein
LNQDTSLDLFHIDENDFENEYNNSREDVLERDEGDDNDLLYDPNFSGGEHSNSNTYGYTSYSLPSFPPQYFTRVKIYLQILSRDRASVALPRA